MDGLDDLAMALAIGLPIVLVSAGGIFVALAEEGPAARSGPIPASDPLPPQDPEAQADAHTGRNR